MLISLYQKQHAHKLLGIWRSGGRRIHGRSCGIRQLFLQPEPSGIKSLSKSLAEGRRFRAWYRGTRLSFTQFDLRSRERELALSIKFERVLQTVAQVMKNAFELLQRRLDEQRLSRSHRGVEQSCVFRALCSGSVLRFQRFGIRDRNGRGARRSVSAERLGSRKDLLHVVNDPDAYSRSTTSSANRTLCKSLPSRFALTFRRIATSALRSSR